MVGNISPLFKHNQEPERQQFMHSYCSLCYALRTQHSLAATLMLNTELSLVLLALSQDTPDKKATETKCPAQFMMKKRDCYTHEVADLAADLSIILAWLKSKDHIADNYPSGNIPFYRPSRWLYKKLDKKSLTILKGLRAETRAVIDSYLQSAIDPNADFDQVRQQTHLLSAVIAGELASKTQASTEKQALISNIFGYVGELIAILDPILDVKKDLSKNKNNPILDQSADTGKRMVELYNYYCDVYLAVEQELISILDTNAAQLPAAFVLTLQNSLAFNRQKIYASATSFFGEFSHRICEKVKTSANHIVYNAQHRFGILHILLMGMGMGALMGCELVAGDCGGGGGGGGCNNGGGCGGGNDCNKPGSGCNNFNESCKNSGEQCSNTCGSSGGDKDSEMIAGDCGGGGGGGCGKGGGCGGGGNDCGHNSGCDNAGKGCGDSAKSCNSMSDSCGGGGDDGGGGGDDGGDGGGGGGDNGGGGDGK